MKKSYYESNYLKNNSLKKKWMPSVLIDSLESSLKMQSNQPNSQENPNFSLEDETLVKEPPMYKVIILNDDFTPMEFVVYVLQHFFLMDELTAHQVMLDVHKKGAGIAGVYTYEVAETKSMQVNRLAKENKYPLKTIIEEADKD